MWNELYCNSDYDDDDVDGGGGRECSRTPHSISPGMFGRQITWVNPDDDIVRRTSIRRTQWILVLVELLARSFDKIVRRFYLNEREPNANHRLDVAF